MDPFVGETDLPTYAGYSLWAANDGYNGYGILVNTASLDKWYPTGKKADNGQREYAMEFTDGTLYIPKNASQDRIATIGTKICTEHLAYFDTKVPRMMHRKFLKLGKFTAPRSSFSPSKEARMMFSVDKNALKVIHKSWNDTNSFLYFRVTKPGDPHHEVMTKHVKYLNEQVKHLTKRDQLAPLFHWFDSLFLKPALVRNGLQLQHAGSTLRADPAVVMQAVRSNGDALQFASEKLKADPYIALVAIENNPHAICFVSRRALANDDAFLSSAKRVLGKGSVVCSWRLRIMIVRKQLHDMSPTLALPLASELSPASPRLLWSFLLHPNTKWLLRHVLPYVNIDLPATLVRSNEERIQAWRQSHVYVCTRSSTGPGVAASALKWLHVYKGDKVIRMASESHDMHKLYVRSEDGSRVGYISSSDIATHYTPDGDNIYTHIDPDASTTDSSGTDEAW